MKILLIRLSSLGDVLLATAAAGALKKRRPDAEIDFCVDPRFRCVLEGNGNIAGIIECGRDRGGLARACAAARKGRYDAVADLQGKLRSMLVSAASGAPLRFRLRKRGWAELAGFVMRRRPLPPSRHMIELCCETLAPLGVEPSVRRPEMVIPAAERDAADRILREWFGDARRRLVGVHPAAGHATKVWPAEKFATLVSMMEGGLAEIVLLGGPADARVVSAVKEKSGAGHILSTEGMGVLRMAAVMERCACVVSCDSAPVHIASSLGIPIVGIYGPTSPMRWGPVEVPHRIIRRELPCSPCSYHGGAGCPEGHLKCMAEIEPGEVRAAVEQLLGEDA